jgi:hypothetical protein
MRTDWSSILADLAYLLGEPDPSNREDRTACGERVLAAHLDVARSTLKGWIDGSEPKHSDGEMLLQRWCALTGKARSFAPLRRVSMSAADVR